MFLTKSFTLSRRVRLAFFFFSQSGTSSDENSPMQGPLQAFMTPHKQCGGAESLSYKADEVPHGQPSVCEREVKRSTGRRCAFSPISIHVSDPNPMSNAGTQNLGSLRLRIPYTSHRMYRNTSFWKLSRGSDYKGLRGQTIRRGSLLRAFRTPATAPCPPPLCFADLLTKAH